MQKNSGTIAYRAASWASATVPPFTVAASVASLEDSDNVVLLCGLHSVSVAEPV